MTSRLLLIQTNSIKSLSPKRSQLLSFGFRNEGFQVSKSLTENINIKNKRKIALKSTAD